MKEEIGLCRPKLAIVTTVFERMKGLYNVQCILNIAGTAFWNFSGCFDVLSNSTESWKFQNGYQIPDFSDTIS